MNITPQTELAKGTKVSVQGKLGIVTGCRRSRDQHGGPINVHTVLLTQRYSHSVAGKAIYKPMNETKEVNYSFIQTR